MYSYHQSLDALAAALNAALIANREHIAGFHVRCVAFKDQSSWVNRLCTFRGFGESAVPSCDEGLRDYGQVGLFEMVLPPSDIPRVIAQMSEGRVVLGEFELKLGPIPHWQEEKASSQNSYCEMPARVFRGRPIVSPPSTEMQLLHFELDCFPTVSHATKAWSGLRNPSVASTSDIGGVIIVVPEFRAAIRDFIHRNGQVFAVIEKGERAENLVLQVTWQKRAETKHARLRVTDGEIQLPDVRDCEEFYIWLIDDSGETLDSHQEFAFRGPEMRRVIRRDNFNEKLAPIISAIDSGEGELTEFKPFIRPGDPKMSEIVETAIAFANNKGGRIFIGVNDACQVVGIETGLRAAHKRHSRSTAVSSTGEGDDNTRDTLKEACEWYIGTLRSKLRGEILPDLDLKIESAELSGATIIVVTIDDGLTGVYQSKEKGAGVWIRRGANNVHAPTTEWKRLLERQEPQSPFRLNFG